MTLCFEISGCTLKYLHEISDKLFGQLKEVLIAGSTSDKKAISSIKDPKLQLFFEIFELLDKIGTLAKTSTNELLDGIKDLLISKQTSTDSSNHSAVNAEVDTVNRIRDVIEQMLVLNGIPQENAKQAVDDLESNVLNETLKKVKLVFNSLKAIHTCNQKDLLINFNIACKQKKNITSLIVEALQKGWYKLRKAEI